MSLICIALLGMASHIVVSMSAMQKTKRHPLQLSSQDKAEALKQTPYNSIATGGDSIVRGGGYYMRSWNVTTSGNMKTVALSIMWKGRTMNTSVVVTL